MSDDAAAGVRLGWVSLPILGLAAVGAASIATQFGGGRPWAAIVLMVIPDLSQGGAAYVRPWSSQLAVLAGITCALALAGSANLVLRAVDQRHPGRRFGWLWASTFFAALATTGAVALGQVLGLAQADAGSTAGLAAAAGQAAVAAVRWGLLSGAAAAAVTTWLAPRRPAAAIGAVLHRRLALAGGLGVATMLAAGQLVGVAVSAAAFSVRLEHPASRPVPVAMPTPSADPSDPALLTNPEPAKPFPGRCEAGSVTISYRLADAAAGTRFGLLTIQNTGRSACLLKGYPDLAFADVEGNNVRVSYTRGRWDGVTNDKPRRVWVESGGTARAELRWRGDAGAGDREVPTILAAPWAGAKRTVLADRFDVKNGSTMRVSPWLPTA